MKKIFLVAGEASGDIAGRDLMEELHKSNPAIFFSGVFGPKMRSIGGEVIMKMEELQVIGFWDVIASLPSIIKKFREVEATILRKKPNLVILIDYPGFNLRLAKSLRKKGYTGKIVQYICPTVWAWRASRKETLEKYFDALFVLLPFEKDYFKDSPLRVEYVGHPLRTLAFRERVTPSLRSQFSIPERALLFAFFPGSRPREVDLNLPLMSQVILKLAERDKKAYFAISSASPKIQGKITRTLTSLGLGHRAVIVPSQLNHQLMQETDAALAKSGTIVLELALLNTPAAVVYKIRWIERFILGYLFRVTLPHFTLPNILYARELYREYIRNEEGPEVLADELKDLAQNESRRIELKETLKSLPALLSPAEGSPKLSTLILQLLENERGV